MNLSVCLSVYGYQYHYQAICYKGNSCGREDSVMDSPIYYTNDVINR